MPVKEFALRSWLGIQRNTKNRIDPSRRQRLEALPGWSWDARSYKWEEGFSYLNRFSEQHGHCRVPKDHKASDGYRLGSWVTNQRTTKDTMLTDRRKRLQALTGWSWNVWSEKWEEGFSHLQEFSHREKHCRVSVTFKTHDGYQLGQWVSIQRNSRSKMDTERQRRLEALVGWSWNAIDDRWEEGFASLEEFSKREGHCQPPKGYKSETAYPLGNWVATQRHVAKDSARRKRLESLLGWSWDPYSQQWEEGFFHLKEYSEREQHCRVPYLYTVKLGYKLGAWVARQRHARTKMDPDRQRRLEALPGWVWEVEK